MKAFLLTVFTLLSFASLASALTQTETFDTSVPSAANPGTINFTGLGLAPADVTAIDLAFTYELATAASHELPLPGSFATDLNITSSTSIVLDNFSANITAGSDGGTSDSASTFYGVAVYSGGILGSINLSENFNTTTDSYSVNNITSFFASNSIDYQVLNTNSFSVGGISSNPFSVSFSNSGTSTIRATATYTLVPEPSAGLLFGIGLALLIGRRRR